jgi:stigma-specific protein Stig1
MGDWHLHASARKHRSYSVIAQVALVIGLCMASFAASAQPLSCPTGQSVCAGSCVNTFTDIGNCGGCGITCTVGQMCTAGQCMTTSCPAGQGLCSGNCVNISTDPLNCGSCGHTCTVGQVCTAGQCSQAGPTSGGDVFACEFTVGKLAGNTIAPTSIRLTGPAGQPCSNNYGSSGVQVIAPFACAFSVGKLAGDTIVPTGISLTGPMGATCTDNYGSSGTQVPVQN